MQVDEINTTVTRALAAHQIGNLAGTPVVEKVQLLAGKYLEMRKSASASASDRVVQVCTYTHTHTHTHKCTRIHTRVMHDQ